MNVGWCQMPLRSPRTACCSTVIWIKRPFDRLYLLSLRIRQRFQLVRSLCHQYSLLFMACDNLRPANYTLWCFKEHSDKPPPDSDQLPVFLLLDWHLKWNNHWTCREEAIFFFFWSAQRHLYPLSVRQQRAIGGLLGCLWGFRWCGGVGRSAQKCHVYDCLCRFMPEMQPLHLGVLPADETPLVVSFFPRRFQLLVAKEVEGVSLSRHPRYDGFTADWFRAVTLKVLFVNLQISFTLNIQPQMQRHIL